MAAEKIAKILVKCLNGHRSATQFKTTNMDTFKQFVKEGHCAICPTCGVSVIATYKNTTYVAEDGRFGMLFSNDP